MRIVKATVQWPYPLPGTPVKAKLIPFTRNGIKFYRVVSIDSTGRETKGSANTLSELTGKSFYPDLLVTDVDYILAGGNPRHILDNPNDWTIQGIQNRFDGVRNSLPAIHDEGYYVSQWD